MNFRVTVSSFGMENVKNEAILCNSARPPKRSAEPTASCQCVWRFFQSMCLKYCACHEISAWPPDMCDSCVSWTAPATRHASLQSLFKRPMHAVVSATAAKPIRLARFWEGTQSIAPATQNDASTWTSKNGPDMWCFYNFGLLRATAASTSQLPKVLRNWGALHILTWKCASLNISIFNDSSAGNVLVSFRPSGATTHYRKTVSQLSTFLRGCIYFLLTLSLLLSADSFLWCCPPCP